MKGLKHIPNVDQTHPEVVKISSKVTRYMAEAVKLKEMLQRRRNLAMTADEELQKKKMDKKADDEMKGDPARAKKMPKRQELVPSDVPESVAGCNSSMGGKGKGCKGKGSAWWSREVRPATSGVAELYSPPLPLAPVRVRTRSTRTRFEI